MSLKKWFYSGGTQKLVNPTPDLGTPGCRRKAGESMGGWDSEWHAAL